MKTTVTVTEHQNNRYRYRTFFRACEANKQTESRYLLIWGLAPKITGTLWSFFLVPWPFSLFHNGVMSLVDSVQYRLFSCFDMYTIQIFQPWVKPSWKMSSGSSLSCTYACVCVWCASIKYIPNQCMCVFDMSVCLVCINWLNTYNPEVCVCLIDMSVCLVCIKYIHVWTMGRSLAHTCIYVYIYILNVFTHTYIHTHMHAYIHI